MVVCTDCNAVPYWRESTEQHHVSLVASITAACTSIRPMLISTRKTMDQEISETFFFRWGSYVSTKKGYMTEQSMLFWINNILAPYVNYIRSTTNGPKHCVVICDGCSSHYSIEIQKALDLIGSIKFIFLPPHSSHLSQMLDATLFSSLKKKYTNIEKELFYTHTQHHFPFGSGCFKGKPLVCGQRQVLLLKNNFKINIHLIKTF